MIMKHEEWVYLNKTRILEYRQCDIQTIKDILVLLKIETNKSDIEKALRILDNPLN